MIFAKTFFRRERNTRWLVYGQTFMLVYIFIGLCLTVKQGEGKFGGRKQAED